LFSPFVGCNRSAPRGELGPSQLSKNMATQDRPEWVTAVAGAVILGCSRVRLPRLAENKIVSSKRVAGGRRLYSRADLERLAEASITPAKRTTTVAMSTIKAAPRRRAALSAR
jgi:hypothetical protein